KLRENEKLTKQILGTKINEEKGIKAILSGQNLEQQESSLEIELREVKNKVLVLREKIGNLRDRIKEEEKNCRKLVVELEEKKVKSLDTKSVEVGLSEKKTEIERLKQDLTKIEKELEDKQIEIFGLQQAKEILEKFQKEVTDNLVKKALAELLEEIRIRRTKTEAIKEKLKAFEIEKKNSLKQ